MYNKQVIKRAISSVGQSNRLITGRSKVRALDGPPAGSACTQSSTACSAKPNFIPRWCGSDSARAAPPKILGSIATENFCLLPLRFYLENTFQEFFKNLLTNLTRSGKIKIHPQKKVIPTAFPQCRKNFQKSLKKVLTKGDGCGIIAKLSARKRADGH